MALDEKLAGRIRQQLGKRRGLTDKQMSGGRAFLLNGNMCCGVHGDGVIVRLDPEETEEALARPHTHLFDLTGRPMKGWILVKPQGLATDAALGRWVGVATKFAGSLPSK